MTYPVGIVTSLGNKNFLKRLSYLSRSIKPSALFFRSIDVLFGGKYTKSLWEGFSSFIASIGGHKSLSADTNTDISHL